MVRSIIGKHPGYFEAIIQLRDVSEELYYYAKSQLEEAGVYIAKIKKVKNGYDLFVADNQFAKSLGKRLQEQYGGGYQVTASLFSRKDGKEIYRTTILFRGMQFKKGDEVVYQGRTYLIKIMGKDIMLQDVKTGQKVHLKYKEMKLVKKKES